MTESLLAATLERDDVHELFDWLRGLSFISVGRRGRKKYAPTKGRTGNDTAAMKKRPIKL